ASGTRATSTRPSTRSSRGAARSRPCARRGPSAPPDAAESAHDGARPPGGERAPSCRASPGRRSRAGARQSCGPHGPQRSPGSWFRVHHFAVYVVPSWVTVSPWTYTRLGFHAPTPFESTPAISSHGPHGSPGVWPRVHHCARHTEPAYVTVSPPW